MKTGILHLHHYLPYLILLFLVISILRAALNKISNVKKDKILLFTLILAHIQLLIGLYIYVPNVIIHADLMYSGDHPITMILGITVLTIGKIKSKRIVDNRQANKIIFIYF